jgi:cyclopropane fatty-acyl-phospholipid synthase-like methyltransferase
MLGNLANAILNPFGFEIRRQAPVEKPWDRHFSSWIADARAERRDPNDVADESWGDVRHLIEKHYGPHLSSEKTVLELGPGSGRITRHIIDRCHRLVLVDFSDFVAQWMREYLTSLQKTNFTVVKVNDCHLRPIGDASIDAIIADGIFHHIDVEDFHRYAAAFRRVLVPGGVLTLNFVNIMAQEGYEFFRSNAERSDDRDIFRWHHPDTVAALFRNLGFEQISITHERVRAGDFVSFLSCIKPR